MREEKVYIDETKLTSAMDVLKAIAHPVRLSMVNFINDNDEVNVNRIYSELKLEQSITSQHLRVLRETGIVNTKREGKYIHYSVNTSKLATIGTLVNDFFEKK